MNKAARAERLASGRAIGRTAWRLARACPIEGFIEPRGDGRKRLRTYRREALRVDLYEAAAREPSPADRSAICITYGGKLRLHVTWDGLGDFRVIHFDRIRTDWLRWLDVEPQQHRRRARA